MRHKNHLLVPLALTTILCFCSSNIIAQYPIVMSCRDSVIASEQSPFVYNLLHFENRNAVPYEVNIEISGPKGWKVLTEIPKTIQLPPHASTTIPVTLIRQSNASVLWQSVDINVTSKINKLTHHFLIKATPVSSFIASPVKEILLLPANVKEVNVPVLIRNTGSVKGRYSVAFKSDKLAVYRQITVSLPPGKDSVLQQSFFLPGSYKGNDKMIVQVSDTSGITRSFSLEVLRLANELKLHPSAYKKFITEVESGLITLDKEMSYYGALNFIIPVGDATLTAGYRSRMYGALNSVERDVFNLTFNSKNWDIKAGHISDINNFYTYGRGLNVLFKGKTGEEIRVKGVYHADSILFPNDNITLSVAYPSRSTLISHLVSFNVDRLQSLNSFLFSNSWHLLKKKTVDLSFAGGTGIDYYVKSEKPRIEELGYGGGYVFSWRSDQWSMYSSVQAFSSKYPGINKGLQNHDHSFGWKRGHFFAGLFYQSNTTVVQTLKDTLYHSDLFTYNMTKYGMRYGIGNLKNYLSLNIGMFSQKGYYTYSIPEYQFAELAYSFIGKKYLRLNLNSINGYAKNKDVGEIYFTNTSFDIATRYLGIKSFYVQSPVFNENKQNFLRYNKTLLIGPYLRFNLFKGCNINLRYNLSKSLYDSRVASSVGFNAMYSDMKRNTFLSINGTIPIKRSEAPMQMGISSSYVSVSLKKGFSFPLLFKRKYHDLKILAYVDGNHNNIKDPGESTIQDLRMEVNNMQVTTATSGMVILRNADTGMYNINMLETGATKGLIPQNGRTIQAHVNKSLQVAVPFSKSRLISGRINVLLDSLNQSGFVLSNIKVIATSDLSGHTYTVLTNESGEFFFNVPAGTYSVSLNPLAFTANLTPIQLQYQIDVSKNEKAEINFVLREKRRQVRLLVQ